MISNVYNYYASQYATRQSSRHDSHKKSELRSVYNRMVNVNRLAPIYKIDVSEDVQKLAIDIKEGARNLKNITYDLAKDEVDEEASKYKAVSGDESSVGVEYIGEGKPPVDEFQLEVKQLATAQVNTGHYLQPRSRTLEEGTYSFDIDVMDVTYELQYNVERGDNTDSIQKKLTNIINQSKIGVKAEQLTDSLGNVALSIKSDETGTRDMKPVIFEISDDKASMLKGTVNYLGLDRTVNFPANAIFSIDGSTRSSVNNNFTVNKAFEISLNAVSDKPVTIRMEEDKEAVVEDITGLVQTYNEIMDFARESSKQNEAGLKLYKELELIAKRYSNELENSGISITDDGKMQADRGEVIENTKGGTATQELKDFIDALQKKADKMFANPMEYIDKKIVAYKNPVKSFASPYNSSVYAGIMFDGYC